MAVPDLPVVKVMGLYLPTPCGRFRAGRKKASADDGEGYER
jgi:hypothetical protein